MINDQCYHICHLFILSHLLCKIKRHDHVLRQVYAQQQSKSCKSIRLKVYSEHYYFKYFSVPNHFTKHIINLCIYEYNTFFKLDK